MMTLAVVGWLGCTVLGLALVDLDAGPRIVSLSQGHGVSVIDAAGIAVLVAGWTALVLVMRRQGGYWLPTAQRSWSASIAAGAGAALLVVSLAVPDFTGRSYAMGVLLVVLEGAAAAALLAHRRT